MGLVSNIPQNSVGKVCKYSEDSPDLRSMQGKTLAKPVKGKQSAPLGRGL
jgi:hypothetical protein